MDGKVKGTGTDNDDVRIAYHTGALNKVSVNNTKGSMSQKNGSQLCVFIDDLSVADGGRDTLIDVDETGEICIDVDKCSVKSSVKYNLKKSPSTVSGDAHVVCSGTNLYSFLTQAQIDSIQVAFPKGNKCGVKFNAQPSGKKSSLSIDLNNKTGPIPDQT